MKSQGGGARWRWLKQAHARRSGDRKNKNHTEVLSDTDGSHLCSLPLRRNTLTLNFRAVTFAASEVPHSTSNEAEMQDGNFPLLSSRIHTKTYEGV